MKTTTTDYINNLKFEYFKTYSFQRNGDFKILQELHDKRTIGDRLDADERKIWDALTIKIEEIKPSNKILDNTGNLHPSAELITTISKQDNASSTLIEILQTPIEEELMFLCAPVYRDAILFYNTANELIDGINICFQCDRVESINKDWISTDYKTFKYLKQLLLSLGHKIENPEYFTADDVDKMREKYEKEKQVRDDWLKRRQQR